MLGFAMSRRIYLQDLESHYYLSEDGTWVKTCQQAKVFPHTYLALLEGLKQTERRTQVLWCLGSPRLNIYVLVRPHDDVRTQPCSTCPLLQRGPPLFASL